MNANTNKTMSSVYLDADLLKTAKDLKINLSKTLTEGLMIKIGSSSDINDLKEELSEMAAKKVYLEMKLKDLEKDQQVAVKKKQAQSLDDMVLQLKKYKKKDIEGKMQPNVFVKMMKQVANAYNLPYSELVELVDSRSYVNLEESLE